MNLKRGLSLLLCLMLLWVSAIALAEEGIMVASPGESEKCMHEGQTTETTTEEISIVSDGANGHVRHYWEIVTVTCPLCEAGDSVTRTEKTETLPHQYDANGVCAACGYVCPHPDEKREKTEEITGVTVGGPIDGTKHACENHAVIHAVCKDCGAKLDDVTEVRYAEEPHKLDAEGRCACLYTCPHSFNDKGVCTVCGYACPHGFDSTGVCVVCGYACPHSFDDKGVCTVCGYACPHSFDDKGICTVCGYACPHGFDSTGVCVVCGYACPHSFDDKGVCTVCGYACPHSFDDKGVCTLCSYVCIHPQEYRGFENYHQKVKSYQTIGLSGHIKVYDYVKDEKCYLCGVMVAVDVVETADSQSWEEHTFADHGGACTLCGQEPCKHPEGSIRVSSGGRNPSYAQADGTYHTCIYDVIEETRCLECSTVISSKTLEAGRTEKQAHSFGDDGRCHACGYQSTCAHAHTYTSVSADVPKSYEYIDETYHLRTVDLYGRLSCGDCGQTLDNHYLIEENVTEKAHHFYGKDGACELCGAVNACTHPATYVNKYMMNGNYVKVDETYCARTGTQVSSTYCSVCNVLLKEEKTENVTEKRKHDFFLGRCSYCGYVPECGHEKTYVTYDRAYFAYHVPKDDQVHLNYYNLYETRHCAVCEKWLSQQMIEQNCEEPEAHSSDGRCLCGYVASCAHANIREEIYYNEMSHAIQIDARTHSIMMEKYVEDYCEDCSTHLGNHTFVEQVKRVKLHEFYDGVCRLCGYESGCQHANTHVEKDSEEMAWRKKDGKYHTVLLNWYELTVCSDCGETVSRKLIETDDELREEHWYDKAGVCLVCGYVNNVCKHENVSIDTYWDWMGRIVDKNESGHTMAYNVIKKTTCLDCAHKTEEVIAKDQLVTEEHGDDGSGYCGACGYDLGGAACKHENTEEKTRIECQEVLSTNEHEHKIKAIRTTSIICSDCGTWLRSSEEPDQIITEPHDFFLDRCSVCDYKNPCQHNGQTHTESGYSRLHNWTITADSHSFKGDLLTYTVCDLCNSVIAEKLTTVGGSFTEPHEFEENECVFCGYKREASTAPTPGPTAKPSNDSDSTFVPTPRPQAEPTVEPTATPAPQAMVDTLLGAVTEAEAEGSEVSIEVVGAAEIMTETEYTALKTLPAQEQILVTLASIGFEDVVEAAMKAMNVTLSEDAQTLMTQVTERMAAVPEEERAALEEKLAQYFPVEEIEVNGVKTSYFVIDLRIEVDGVVRVERYGFRLDENGEWVFEKLDLKSVEW